MRLCFEPSIASGRISAPPSKSMAHRYLIAAALSEGDCKINNIEFSQDVLATLDCIKAMGCNVSTDVDSVTISHTADISESTMEFRCRESGSTLRFFIPISMISDGCKRFYGSETLLGRPMGVYEDICNAQGIGYKASGECIEIDGRLTAGEYTVRGDISSQFITGLLFALPKLDADSTIKLLPPVESRPYIDMTIEALSRFGVSVVWTDDLTILVKGSQTYHSCDITTEGDYSNAALIDAYNMAGGSVDITGLREDSLQGDRVYRDYFAQMRDGMPTLDISDCPDLGPVLMAVGAACNGVTLVGTDRLKIKESDRGTVMCTELEAFGIKTVCEPNRITVIASELKRPVEALYGHNDHRIVMALSMLLSITGGVLCGAEAVSKSFPSYFDVIRGLGIKVTEDGMD